MAIAKTRGKWICAKKDNRKYLPEGAAGEEGVTSVFCVACLVGLVKLKLGVAIEKLGARRGRRWEQGVWKRQWTLRQVGEGGVQEARTEWIWG